MSLEDLCYIVNPVARGGKSKNLWKNVIKPLLGNISNSNIYFTEKGKTMELAKSLLNDYAVFVAVGGDGTVGDVANALVDTNKVLGIIPVGAGNDFYFSLNKIRVKNKKDYEKVVDILKKGLIKEVDILKATFEDKEKYYMSTAELGFSAEAIRNTPGSIKKVSGTLAYITGVLRTLLLFKPVETVIKFNDRTIEERCLLVEINNGNSAGGGMLVTPNAKVDDGYLDLFYGTNLSNMEILKAFPKVFSGQHTKIDKVYYYSAKEKIKKVEIDTNPKVCFGLDGDLVGKTPVTFEVYGKIRVISN